MTASVTGPKGKSALLLSTILAALPVHPALAATTVSADSTTPLITSTAGDITINDEIELDVEGANPITIDSDASVTINADAIVQADDADGRAGILVTAGNDFSITTEEDSVIYVTEDFVPEDEDGNSVTDGPIAEATGRAGIRVQSDSGTITNGGSIGVEGLNSYGIVFEDDFTGDIVNADTGVIAVKGDYSTAISLQGLDGDLTLGGTISAVGEGARALVVEGDVDGLITIEGTVTTGSSFTTDESTSLSLSRADLRVYAPAVSIEGDVSGGILVAAPPYDLDSSDSDEDDDGITDSDEGTGAIVSYGESPALVIGGADDVTIGTVGSSRIDGEYSLVIDGNVNSYGTYSSFDVTGVIIGGQGGDVDLPGGIAVTGSLTATTVDSTVTTLLINEGATVASLTNDGIIRANISSTGEGSVTAIKDLSGTLTTIDNTGFIYASGANEDETIAFDLRANTSGVTIRQYLNAEDTESREEEMEDEDYDASNPTLYTVIVGDIMTGSGDDVLDVASGKITGDTWLAGGDDVIALYGDAAYVGDVHSGSGAFTMTMADNATFTGVLDVDGQTSTLTLGDTAMFSGSFSDANDLTVTVNGGLLQAADGEVATFDTLVVGADGAIGVVINSEDGTSSSFDVNSATFAEGATLSAEVDSLFEADGSYLVLTADTLDGTPDLTLDTTDTLSVFYNATLTTTDTTITLDVERKSADELGLNTMQQTAFDAILAQAAEYSGLEQSLLQAESLDVLGEQINALLPDHGGGVFDFVTRASRLARRHLMDSATTFESGATNAWLEPFWFTGSRTASDAAAGFETGGMGLSGVLEQDFGIGYIGLSGTWAGGSVTNGDIQDISTSTLELGAHWRIRSGPFAAFVRGSGIRASMSSTRTFDGTIDDTDFTYTTAGDWKGWAWSVSGGASYELAVGERVLLRPSVMVDHFSLSEDGFTEDTVDAFDLIVEDRTSSATTATTSLTAGYRFGRLRDGVVPTTIELEAGYRNVLGGTLGSTTASFEDGETFTLTPDDLEGGWVAEARFIMGGWNHSWNLSAGAEQTQGDIDMSVRGSLTVSF